MNQVLARYAVFVAGVKLVVFWLAVVVAVVALLDWAVRTRRLNPFGAIGRFCRRFVDPLMAPVERRIVRAGGLPASAPWWTLVFVVVGGILLVTALQFLAGFIANLIWGLGSPRRLGVLLLSWTFSLIRIALIVRVVSSWFQISPFSRWIRWSFVLTEWMLAPLRRIVPTLGPIDITPLIAFFLLSLIQGAIGL
ncbi:MAG TPA: YggT family protein [Gemmatimonadaceae bacterium]|nr:YggT family protein [Gemmatimonadaceae bacterium]